MGGPAPLANSQKCSRPYLLVLRGNVLKEVFEFPQDSPLEAVSSQAVSSQTGPVLSASLHLRARPLTMTRKLRGPDAMSTTFLRDGAPYGCLAARCLPDLGDRGLKTRDLRRGRFLDSYRRISPRSCSSAAGVERDNRQRLGVKSLEGIDRQPILDQPALSRPWALTHPEIASRGAAPYPLGHVFLGEAGSAAEA